MRILTQLANTSREKSQQGSSLIVVIMVMLVAFIVAGIVASSNLFLIRQTSGTSDQMKALAAAEAGRDELISILMDGECPSGGNEATGTFSDSSAYITTVYSSAATSDTQAASTDGLSASCPVGSTIDVNSVVIQSIGTSGAATRTVTAVYKWKTIVATNPGPTGALLLSGGLTLNNNQRIAGTGSDIYVRSGNFTCNGTGQLVDGSVYVLAGFAYLTNSCSIGGNLYASGTVKLDNNASVLGDVYAGGDVTLDTSSNANNTVRGTVTTAGTLRLNNTKVGGSVTSTSTSSNYTYATNIGGSLRVAGPFSKIQTTSITGDLVSSSTSMSDVEAGVTVGGNLTFASAAPSTLPSVTGTATYNAVGMTDPIATAPAELTTAINWVDLNYTPSDWTGQGYVISTQSFSSCSYNGWNPGAYRGPAISNAINSATTPTVYDLRGCSGIDAEGARLALKTDIALIIRSDSDFQNVTVTSADGAAHKLYLIVPDTVDDDEATCSASGNISLANSHFSDVNEYFLYTPCGINYGSNDSWTWNGQLYVNSMSNWGNTTIEYTQSTVPGWGTASGGGSGSGTTTSSGLDPTRISQTEE